MPCKQFASLRHKPKSHRYIFCRLTLANVPSTNSLNQMFGLQFFVLYESVCYGMDGEEIIYIYYYQLQW